MTTTEYDPSTALRAFFPDRDERRTARVWSNEALLHDMAETFGFEFFEGTGTNPTSLTGYSSSKIWLRVSAGVTTEPGEVRAYDGSGDATLLASWPVMDKDAFASYIGAGGGAGDVVGPSASVDSEIALFSLTTGKLLKRMTGSGLVKSTSGVASVISPTSNALKVLRVNAGATDFELSETTYGVIDVCDYGGIVKDGSSNTLSSIQTAINTICGAGKKAYIPDGIFDFGSGTLTVPAYGHVICGKNAVVYRSAEPNTAASMVLLSANATWEGGELRHTVVSTSTTSNTIASSGTFTWTVQSGLGYVAGQVIFAWTDANKWMLGTVSSYSGTTLVVSVSSSNGTGTYTTWKFTIASANNAAIRAYNVASAKVIGTRVTSAEWKWYVGICFDTATDALAFDCSVAGIANRGVYVYQTCADITVSHCTVNGGTYGAYGYNVNPANGTCSRIKIINCTATNMASQGFEFGDNTFKSVMSCCTAETIANTGFLIQVANTAGFPQYNSIVGCTAASCTNYGFVLAGCFYNQITACEAVACGVGLLFGSGQISGGTTYYAQLNTVTGFRADACTTNGIQFITTTLRNSCTGVSCIANGGTGVLFDSGSQLNRVSGNAYNNTTANMTDNGTSNIKDVSTS